MPMIVAANPTDLDALRLRNELLEMPGLTISVPQVARILGLRSEHAAAILDALGSEKVLTQTPIRWWPGSSTDSRPFASRTSECCVRTSPWRTPIFPHDLMNLPSGVNLLMRDVAPRFRPSAIAAAVVMPWASWPSAT